jgi:hypothetical protein
LCVAPANTQALAIESQLPQILVQVRLLPYKSRAAMFCVEKLGGAFFCNTMTKGGVEISDARALRSAQLAMHMISLRHRIGRRVLCAYVSPNDRGGAKGKKKCLRMLGGAKDLKSFAHAHNEVESLLLLLP